MMKHKNLAAAGCVVFGIFALFLKPAQYFFGDSIAVLWGRPHSVGSLFKDFVRLDGGHWYRPLSNSLPPFLLWPLFGMNFMPYHLLAIALHSLFCVGLFAVFLRVLRDDWAAFVGVAFFAFHPIQFYSTYDIAFYQEPITAALTLGSLILLFQYVVRPRGKVLIAGLFVFVAALTSKETAVMMPALLVLALAGRTDLYKRPSMRVAVLLAGLIAAAFTLVYAFVLGVTFRYQPTYSPKLKMDAVVDAGRALLWSFGIASGTPTQTWQYSPPIAFGLCLLFSLIVAAALVTPGSGVWRGFIWFLVASGPAFFTRHLLPHHLYLGLVGIAYSIGQTVAWFRSREVSLPKFRSAACALGALTIALVFCAAYIDARADSTSSWVGQSSQRVQTTADFFHSAKIDLAKSAGILAVIGDAQVLRFDWMGGALFNMIGSDDLEARIIDSEPEKYPEGFQVVKWAGNSLHRLAAAESHEDHDSGTLPTVNFNTTANRVYAGRDSYCVNVNYFAGQTIDVKYHYNQRPASIAYSFVHLDARGNACINVGASVPWGNVRVVGVRPSGSRRWYPTNAEIEVLPPLTW
jgi:hypothetical protein